MTTNLFTELEALLASDSQYTGEDGNLLKNKIVEAALQLEPEFIKQLLSNEKLKINFFTEVEGILIFDKVKFQKFVSNKRFLPDSYTSFKNKIGLVGDEGDFLAESKEVVLSWPYKDCVLEGGQTKEDAKRNEVFWNEILAPDEINRLTEPKALTNFIKYDSEGEHKVDSISKDDNLIIKGNNLLALHSLKEKYAGQVKLIYIDPPYNTGNDEFQYNDSFNHSTWLTFIKNRLTVAKSLLSTEGTLFISIDQKEISYLLVLLDEIFGVENRKNIITVKRGSVTGAKVINPGVVNLTEYVLVYSRNTNCWIPNRVFRSKERDDRYNTYIDNYEEGYQQWTFIPLLEAFARFKKIDKKNLKNKLGEYLEEELTSFVINNGHRVIQFASLDDNSISLAACELKKKSKENPSCVYKLEREKKNDYYIVKGKLIIFVKDRLLNIDGEVTFSDPISDIWDDVLPNDLHNEGGVSFRKGKKQEKLLQRILLFGSHKGDLVLDFHLGSGTTASVAHKMERRYIGIEQLDYGENDSVSRLKNTINGEQSGISKAVNWQGGGSFIYCELAKSNQNFVDKILKANTKNELQTIWQSIQETGFLSWKVNPKEINDKISDFTELDLDDMKRFLIEVLDKNLLYVPYSEIDNEEFEISEEDKRLNKIFYAKKV